MAGRDFYDILGVPRTATPDEIKAAYRRLARTLHPDVNKAADAQARFTEVQEAYDVLSDEDKRRLYDRAGHAAFTTGARPGAGGGPRGGTYTWTNVGGGGPGSANFDMDDIGSMFDAFFAGRPGAGERPRRAKARPARGADGQASVDVDFAAAALGGSVSIRVQRGGATRSLDVDIPPGARDGAKLRVRGEGHPSSTGGEAGDLILTIHVRPHPLFRYASDDAHADRALDLAMDLPLTIAEATLGTTLEVPTLDGTVDLRVPPGTDSGKRLRLAGRGAGPAGQRGNLIAIVRVTVPAPDTLTESERRTLREIGRRTPAPRAWPGGAVDSGAD